MRLEELLFDGFKRVFVSGKAGTGKTTLINYLRNTIEKNIVVVAPIRGVLVEREIALLKIVEDLVDMKIS